jgi:uncharacterized protein
MFERLLALFISFLSSSIGAISGIGGGVIIKPIFDLASIGGNAEVSFLTGCTVLAMASVSLLRCRGSGIAIDWKTSPWLAAGSAAGGVGGKLLFNALSYVFAGRAMVLSIQSALLTLLGAGVLAYLLFKPRIKPHAVRHPAASLGIGAALGCLSAFLGIGGGPMNIIALYFIFSMGTKESSLNSLFIIFISQAASLILTLASGTVPPHDNIMLALMALGGISGALLGSALLKRLPCPAVERIYATVIFLVLCTSVYNLASAIK